MNLWVRSQDKEKLLKCNDIAISNNVINERESIKFKGYKIVGYFDKNTEYEILGTYETKERAIEVLDEIQNILKPKIVIKFDNKPKYLEDGTINDVLTPREEIDYSEQLSTYVYEMPEK